MLTEIRLTDEVRGLLRCPRCGGELAPSSERFDCTNSACAAGYPLVDGVPVLIDELKSVFDLDDFTTRSETFFDEGRDGTLMKVARRLTPTIGRNIHARENYAKFSDALFERTRAPRVLVLGGSILGAGMDDLAANGAIELVESDVAFGPRTALICDAHDIPFADASFDGVVVQAVLEHVADPYRCCDEIHRVLKEDGLVYAETPFMQQVHGGRFDFTRFTHLGHRRLFRRFEEIESGAVCGPGMALAWSYQYFLMSFARSRAARKLLRGIASLTAFHLKYFDYLLIDRPAALDAASGVYFLGVRSQEVLSDKELILRYRGAD